MIWVDTLRLSAMAEIHKLAVSWREMTEFHTSVSVMEPSMTCCPVKRGKMAGMRVTANGVLVSIWVHVDESGDGMAPASMRPALMEGREGVVLEKRGWEASSMS